MKFRDFLTEGTASTLLNAKLSYSVKGSSQSSGDLSWTMFKQNLLISDVKRRKPLTAYRTYSLSERDWVTLFEGGYTELGNVNTEKGITSFTVDKKMLNRFRGGGDVTITIEVKLKKYSEILGDSVFPEEKEIIGHNVKWRVTGLDDTSTNWYIIGEQV